MRDRRSHLSTERTKNKTGFKKVLLIFEKLENAALTKGVGGEYSSPNTNHPKYDDGEKVLPQTLQRVAGRCEAMRSGKMSLAPE